MGRGAILGDLRGNWLFWRSVSVVTVLGFYLGVCGTDIIVVATLRLVLGGNFFLYLWLVLDPNWTGSLSLWRVSFPWLQGLLHLLLSS